jgi:hypothetical protein
MRRGGLGVGGSGGVNCLRFPPPLLKFEGGAVGAGGRDDVGTEGIGPPSDLFLRELVVVVAIVVTHFVIVLKYKLLLLIECRNPRGTDARAVGVRKGVVYVAGDWMIKEVPMADEVSFVVKLRGCLGGQF